MYRPTEDLQNIKVTRTDNGEIVDDRGQRGKAVSPN